MMPKGSKTAPVPASLPDKTFVVDNGAYNIKAGYAPTVNESDHQTLSKCRLIPNTIVRSQDRKTYIGAQADQDITQWSEAVYRRPVECGQVVGWEVQKAIWEHSFLSKQATVDLRIDDPLQTTLILGEAPNVLPALQKNTDEIVMEEFGFGGYMKSNCEWIDTA